MNSPHTSHVENTATERTPTHRMHIEIPGYQHSYTVFKNTYVYLVFFYTLSKHTVHAEKLKLLFNITD